MLDPLLENNLLIQVDPMLDPLIPKLNQVDPMLDPLLEKAIVKKGKNFYINISDQNMDYSSKFYLFMTSRLPNPHFSPELSAKYKLKAKTNGSYIK
jgi:dynein heavy chain, axonemal